MASMIRPSFILTVRHIYSNQGVPGFFRGLGPCILRAFPVNACAFFVYEGLMRGLGAEQVIIFDHHAWSVPLILIDRLVTDMIDLRVYLMY